jgi:hypothetical protein
MQQLFEKDYEFGLNNWKNLENPSFLKTNLKDLELALDSIVVDMIEMERILGNIVDKKNFDIVKSVEVLHSIAPKEPSMMEKLSAYSLQQQEKRGRQ